MLTTRPRGTQDILPDEAVQWVELETRFRSLCASFGYGEIRTPIIEHTELFSRGVGEQTDVVQKEMYTFQDRGGRSITLRAEGTAPVARAYIESRLDALVQPVKLFYIAPVFRYERPQAGRLRQHHQLGIEAFGSRDYLLDTEVIHLAMEFLKGSGLSGLTLYVNSMGCPACRGRYKDALLGYYSGRRERLCDDCRRRLDANPLRLLDCKEPRCAAEFEGAPRIASYLCAECAEHFEGVKRSLRSLGHEFAENPRLVRGFDYYSNTVFEIISRELGAQNTVCGGGRYDGLVEQLGGKPAPGVGFGMGIERLLIVMKGQGVSGASPQRRQLFIVTTGSTRETGFLLAQRLRGKGIRCDIDYLERSVKAQMKYADKQGFNYVLFLGEEERARGVAVLKNMSTAEQKELSTAHLEQYILRSLGGEHI
ncbi:MAG: histidine--tRNA ligase [Bacillota bacterium]